MDITQVLLNAQSADANQRGPAETQLKTAENQNFGSYITALAQELNKEDKPMQSRHLAGILLKNCFSSKDETVLSQLHQRWKSLDTSTKSQVKKFVLSTLGSPVNESRFISAQICSAIACVDLPENQWPELIPALCTTTHGDNLRLGCLQALGCICDEVDAAVIENNVNSILTAVASAAVSQQTNMELKYAAFQALLNSLEFAKTCFNNQNERNYIILIILEATNVSIPEKIKKVAYQCIVKICSTYYDKLQEYIQGIFNMTINAIKNESEAVALQAIEVWSTLAEQETFLNEEDEGAKHKLSRNYVLGALQHLVDALWTTLIRQEEDQDEDTWNISSAGATCLSLVASCVGDAILPVIMPPVSSSINNTDWRQREAATVAFGSVLDGPGTPAVKNYVVGALPIFLSHLSDSDDMVKDTTAWTLGRIAQFHRSTIEAKEQLMQILAALFQSLEKEKSTPKVACNVCWAISSIAEAFHNDLDSSKTSNPVSQYFQYLTQGLLKAAERPDASEDRLRSTAYGALNTLVHCAPPDCMQYVLHLVPIAAEKLKASMQSASTNANNMSSEERKQAEEVQSLLCGVLTECTMKLGKAIDDGLPPVQGQQQQAQQPKYADGLMQLFLELCSGPSKTSGIVQEEALHAISAMANALEQGFGRYLSHVLPLVISALSNPDEYEVCVVAVGVAADIFRSCDPSQLVSLGALSHIIPLLLRTLELPNADSSLKPPILATFGDIAFYMGEHFLPHARDCINMLHEASTAAKVDNIDELDDDEIDNLNELRENICQGYSGIIHCLTSCQRANELMTCVQPILDFMTLVIPDPNKTDNLTRSVVGLLGDLAQSLGQNVKPYLQTASVYKVLDEVRDGDYTNPTIEIAVWAKQTIMNL